MARFIRRPTWHIPESQVTDPHFFWNRRHILKGMALCIAGPSIAACKNESLATQNQLLQNDPTSSLYPAKPNDLYKLDRELTDKAHAESYNNFYEFGSHKTIAGAAQSLKTRPWTITLDGKIDNPQTLDIDDLIRSMPLEERLYRHRCVEAWAMAVPWTGFPLKELIKKASPQAACKYIRFESFFDPDIADGQRQNWYPWPYIEGITLDEGLNDLSFLVTGVYGAPLKKQYGAPLRLALPWKYGFKSAKSIVRITFTDQMPKTFWMQAAPIEYGFYANINPETPHRRWSQETEKMLGTNEVKKTLLYNGYANEVAYLYKKMQNQKIWY